MARRCATRRSHLPGGPQLAVAVGLSDHNPVLAQVITALCMSTPLWCWPSRRSSTAVIWIVVARILAIAVTVATAVVVVAPFRELPLYMSRPVSTKVMALLLLIMALEMISLVQAGTSSFVNTNARRRHLVGCAAPRVKALESTSLAKLPYPADHASDGSESNGSPATGVCRLFRLGLAEQLQLRGPVGRVLIHLIARSLGAEGPPVVGVGVHAISHTISHALGHGHVGIFRVGSHQWRVELACQSIGSRGWYCGIHIGISFVIEAAVSACLVHAGHAAATPFPLRRELGCKSRGREIVGAGAGRRWRPEEAGVNTVVARRRHVVVRSESHGYGCLSLYKSLFIRRQYRRQSLSSPPPSYFFGESRYRYRSRYRIVLWHWEAVL